MPKRSKAKPFPYFLTPPSVAWLGSGDEPCACAAGVKGNCKGGSRATDACTVVSVYAEGNSMFEF